MALGEFDIIRKYFERHSKRQDVLLGIGDDAAVLRTSADRRLVVAVDTIVEGVHFPVGTQAADIGYRALAVNLSDLAAMGAEPSWMTLSLSLPQSNERWLQDFAAGLFHLAERYDVALIGGDTVKGPLVVTVQIAGYVEADSWLTRSGARAGDHVCVSGVPGEAAAGLAVIERSLSGAAAEYLRQRFLRPEPRIALGRQLRGVATAAMDISDGLLTDLDKLCAASHCGAVIDMAALPRSQPARTLFDESACVDFVLAGGDDYELLFTLPAEAGERDWPLRCTRIGRIVPGSGVQCMRDGQPVAVARRGYDHFAGTSKP